MSVKILIPTPLRRFVDGAKSVEVEAATVAMKVDLSQALAKKVGAAT